jgi:hypothetical protein
MLVREGFMLNQQAIPLTFQIRRHRIRVAPVLRLYHPGQAAPAAAYVEHSLLAIRDHAVGRRVSRAARARKCGVDQCGRLDLTGDLNVDFSYATGADAVRHLVG